VTDFPLDLSASLFDCPTIAQVSISADLARRFLHFPFRFIDSASDLVFRARFHEKESLFMKVTDVNFEPASAHAIATGSEHEETAPGWLPVRKFLWIPIASSRTISNHASSASFGEAFARRTVWADLFSRPGCGGYRTRWRRGRDSSFQGVDVHRLIRCSLGKEK
jgi:hypothetical protein